jgi:hypothetical protein
VTEKPRLGFLVLLNMSAGFFGIQFGWGLQMAKRRRSRAGCRLGPA